MTRRSWIPSLILGLAACGLSGCLRRDVNPVGYVNPAGMGGDPGPAEPASAHDSRLPATGDHKPNEPIQPAHFPDEPPPVVAAPPMKDDEPPPPPPAPPPPADAPVVQADKAPQDPPVVAAFRDLLQNRSPDALEQLRAYDGASRELLLTLLPLAARVGDGAFDRATPQEAAVLLDQVRQVEALLRPRAALALDRVCLCRQIKGFGDCEPWPPDHVFQTETDDRRGERMQVYVEVRNFTSRPRGPAYETSLAGVVEIRDFNKGLAARFDFPAGVDRSQTPRQDYFINFQFHLPRLPEGRYTLHVLVKDVLAPVGDDAAPRTAGRSIDFAVGGAGSVRAGRD